MGARTQLVMEPNNDHPEARQMELGGAPTAGETSVAHEAPGAPPDRGPRQAAPFGGPGATVRAARPALIALARARLRGTTGGRLSALLGALLTAAFCVVAIALRVGDGTDAPLGGLLETATRAIAWAVGAPLALAVAHDRARADRADGIEALAATRGVPRRALDAVRTVSAMIQTTLSIGVPVLVLSSLSVALAGSVQAAAGHAGLGGGLVLFSVLAGATIGGSAAACGRIGGPRGRTLLAVVFFVPWILSDLLGYRAWSIPGALDAALVFVVRTAGMRGAYI